MDLCRTWLASPGVDDAVLLFRSLGQDEMCIDMLEGGLMVLMYLYLELAHEVC